MDATVTAVLAGKGSYDDLPDTDQAIVRAVWAARIEQRRTALNFAEEFRAQGRTWVEADAQGRGADGR